jgi:hypothetical protein
LKNPPHKIVKSLKKMSNIELEEFFLTDKNKTYYVMPKKIDDKTLQTGKNLSYFIFPYFLKKEKTSLTKLDKKEILFGLIYNCINVHFHKKEILDFIFELINETTGYKLLYNDFTEIEGSGLDI